MPFTISHAAAVLPLKNTRLPMAALMIGSMSPDFAYFLPGGLTDLSSHSLMGILLFCLPAGLLVWQLYVRVLERPTIEMLPEAWRERVAHSDLRLSTRALLLAAMAVLVGAVTHVVWDAFTHSNTPITNAFPVLRAEIFTLDGRSIRLYFFLQCLCSVAGLLALAIWALNLRRLPPRVRPRSPQHRPLSSRARLAAVTLMFAISGVSALLHYASYSGSRFEHQIFQLLIGAMIGWAIAWLVVAWWISRIAITAPSGRW